MKKSLFIILAACLISFNSTASDSCQKKGEDWKQKIMSEKIAFFTTEIGITPEEGQAFWPVYNQVNKENDEAMRQIFKSYKALAEAIDGNRPEREVKSLLDAYLRAMERHRELENMASDKYMKVLPVEKVARLYLAEEKFRRQQIHKLHGGKNHN